MLGPILSRLNAKSIVLGSTSPRRREILSMAGLSFRVVPSRFEENLLKSDYVGRPWDYAKATARGKTEEVFQRLAAENSPPNLIIGADSIVILDGEILEKPRSEKDATSMLHRLSGRTHSVISGVALGVPSKDNTGLTLSTFHEETTVDFASITGDMIDYYVSTKEPMDKAGSYGIQGVAGSFVTAIQGDFYNVMGLPLHRTCKEILKLWDRGLL